MVLINLEGQTFGTFVVARRSRDKIDAGGKAYWDVVCSACGATYCVRSDNLRRGAVTCQCQGPTCLKPRKVPRGTVGARKVTATGYVVVYAPWHANADAQGWIREHRLIMALHLGRSLTQSEVVHHVNGNRADNRLENLMLFESDAAHDEYERANGWPGATDTTASDY